MVGLLLKVISCIFMGTMFLSRFSCDLFDGPAGERPFTVRATRFICSGENSSKYLKINTCNLKLLRNGSSLISANFTILKPLEPVWITMKIWYKTNGRVFKPMFGIDERVEVCQVLANGVDVKPINKLMYNIFKQYLPHFLRPCPLLVSLRTVWSPLWSFTNHKNIFLRANTALRIFSLMKRCFHRLYLLEITATICSSYFRITRLCFLFNSRALSVPEA